MPGRNSKMWMALFGATALVAVAGVAGVVYGVAASDDDDELGKVEIGEQVPDFTMQDHNGKEWTLSKLEGKLVVLDVRCHMCPWVRGADPVYNKTVAKYGERDDVVFLGIDPHEFTSTEDVKAYNEEAEVKQPVLKDYKFIFVNKVGATRTPEIYIVDNRDKDNPMVLRYHGAVDDRNAPPDPGERNYVNEALEALVKGEPVEMARTSAWGCTIKR